MVKAQLFVFALILSSCSMGMFESLARTDRDPDFVIPAVHSFAEENAIIVEWPEDEAADEYFLYRAQDSLSPVYTLVYRGKLLKYHDRFFLVNQGERYLYRLGKRRGGKMFGDLESPGKAALGVVSGDLKDVYEPNDVSSGATFLNSTVLHVNSYLYGSNYIDGIGFYDEDWYCVDILPHWAAEIKLEDLHIGGVTGSGQHFTIGVLNEGTETIYHAMEAEIKNEEDTARRLYFRISPDNYTFFIEHPDSSGGGIYGYGAFVPYTIRIADYHPIRL
jgi:hypothetical protein